MKDIIEVEETSKNKTARRSFLKKSLGACAVGVVAVTASAKVVEAAQIETLETQEEPSKVNELSGTWWV